MNLKFIQKKVNFLSFLILITGIIFIGGCVMPPTGENATNQSTETAVRGLQIVLKDLGFPEIKYLQPTIQEIQLQNENGQWITIWSDPAGKALKLTPDGAETVLDTVSVPAGTYVRTRLKVSSIDVEADINRDGDTLDKNVEVVLTLEEFNSLPQPEKPSAPNKPEQPSAPNKPDKPQAPEMTGGAVASQDEPSAPDQPSAPDKPSEPDKPSAPSEPDQPSAPEEPQASFRIEEGIVHMGEYLDEIHTATPPYWDGVDEHYGEYLFPLWDGNFVYSGSGGKIVYDFSLHPLLQKRDQISVEVSITD